LALGLATMPFDFEGVRRREQAKASMKEFRAAGIGECRFRLPLFDRAREKC
jgi:hypothetical protein